MPANSRTASTRKTAASRPVRTPRELAPADHDRAEEFEEELDAAGAQEVEAHAVTSDGYITVPMNGADGAVEEVQVLLSSKWRASAMRAINSGDFDGFMKMVLFEDDFDVYVDLDPDSEEIQNFATEVVRLTGENPGKSSGSARSSRRTRKN